MTEVIVLAAGRGKRMRSEQPKVLHRLGGRTLLEHVLHTVRAIEPHRIHVVYGHGGDTVRDSIFDNDINWVRQKLQLGTGHAVAQAIPAVNRSSRVLVVYGDIPLICKETFIRLVEVAGTDGLALLTTEQLDAAGYGRIVRDKEGGLRKIVEENDASPEECTISELNAGFIVAPAKSLDDWLQSIDDGNSQKEYYLTGIVQVAIDEGFPVATYQSEDVDEVRGINTKAELAQLERIFQRRQATRLMLEGLTLQDPDRFDLRGSLVFGADNMIDINVVLEGKVQLGDRVTIGPNCQIRDSVLGDDVIVKGNCVIEGVTAGAGCVIGPFARLRSETELAPKARVGNFVEMKNSRLGIASKANHLSYLGDSEVGQNVNIGAGVITCNYDGTTKHRTAIGDDAFIGSGSQLVAPVTVGAGATIGAGSTINNDAPAGKLTLARGEQKTVDRWKRTKKKRAD